MKVVLDPPLNRWNPRPALARGGDAGNGGGAPVIATGHQASFWHPGILAKDIAAAIAAKRSGGSVLHVVVDSDVHETMRVDLPVSRDGRLSAVTVQMAPVDVSVPTGMQAAAAGDAAARSLAEARQSLGKALAADVQPLMTALRETTGATTLAQQVAMVTARLMRPYAGEVALCYSSELLRDEGALIDAMLGDARACVSAYNQAASEHPDAGIGPLLVEPDRVELPLWLLKWGRPRERVFADLSDSRAILTTANGEAIADRAGLAPRALLLTAVMRSRRCDLFVHGRGGYVYDRITELWWQRWRGEALSPMTLATADAYLDFDAPVADGKELAKAQWWAHHLPHNLDRHVANGDGLARAKQDLLVHMGDDRDRGRRAAAFARVHAINGELAACHRGAVAAAEAGVMRARMGMLNRAVAMRRDWCFALYPEGKLRELGRRLQIED